MTDNSNNNDHDWNKWENYVLKELERMGEGQVQMNTSLAEIKQEIAVLKAKARSWGAFFGAGVAGMIELIRWLLAEK